MAKKSKSERGATATADSARKPGASSAAMSGAKPGAKPAAFTRRVPLWAGAVIAVQLVMMLMVFNPAAHNGGDTAGYVTLAHSMLAQHTYQDLWQPGQPPHTKYPPIFPALLAIAIALGARTWTALKVVPALFTTLTVLLVYLWARDRRGAPFGAVIALLTAASNAVLWSSHWELSEPPFMALTFLAFWAYERAIPPPARGADARGDHPTADAVRWLAIGTVAVGLAYFTRSAGLPLLFASAAWLLMHKRWRSAAALIVIVGGLALLWSMRGNQGVQYVNEFWMVDPYQPDLGRVGFGGLLGRVWENMVAYVTNYVPIGFTGGQAGPLPAALGILLFALALWGWARRFPRPGVVELFMPMYLGLMFLWPAVWSGDRFALPIMPPLLFYAGEALSDFASERMPNLRKPALGFATAVIALPALGSFSTQTQQGSACSQLVHQAGAFACWGPRTYEFVEAAVWGGSHLPEGAVVLTRKPRIWYVESGVESETFPFTKDVDRFLAFADSVKARYVVMDYLDQTASVYVAGALIAKGGAFCVLPKEWGGKEAAAFSESDGPATQVLGILPPARRVAAEVQQGDNGNVTVAMKNCPTDMLRPIPLAPQTAKTERIPLLDGFAIAPPPVPAANPLVAPPAPPLVAPPPGPRP